MIHTLVISLPGVLAFIIVSDRDQTDRALLCVALRIIILRIMLLCLLSPCLKTRPSCRRARYCRYFFCSTARPFFLGVLGSLMDPQRQPLMLHMGSNVIKLKYIRKTFERTKDNWQTFKGMHPPVHVR